MAIVKITELQPVNQVEELSNEDLTSVVGGLVGGIGGGAAGGGLFSGIPLIGPILSGILAGIPVVGGLGV